MLLKQFVVIIKIIIVMRWKKNINEITYEIQWLGGNYKIKKKITRGI